MTENDTTKKEERKEKIKVRLDKNIYQLKNEEKSLSSFCSLCFVMLSLQCSFCTLCTLGNALLRDALFCSATLCQTAVCDCGFAVKDCG